MATLSYSSMSAAIVTDEGTETDSSSSEDDPDTYDSLDAVIEPCRLRSTAIKASLWEKYQRDATPDVFGYHKVRITSDSGLGKVDKLLYPVQYFYAISKIVSVVVNCYVLFAADIQAYHLDVDDVELESAHNDKFLILAWLACRTIATEGDRGSIRHDLHRLLPVFEIGYMLFNIGAICVSAIAACIMSQCCSERCNLRRWSTIATLFWGYLQEMVSYSALKLVYYVTPTVLATQGYHAVLHAMEHGKGRLEIVWAVAHVLWFVCTRAMVLVLGFDTFLVKFRITAAYIDLRDMDLNSFLIAVSFLYQVLGAVKINQFIRERLIIFLFGGQDGRLDHDEKMLTEVWEALLTRKIFETHGLVKGSVVMLGFDDYDFQLLALDDDEIEIRKKEEEDMFEKGDRVRVTKDGPLKDKCGHVVNPGWHGLVKVKLPGHRSCACMPDELEMLNDDGY